MSNVIRLALFAALVAPAAAFASGAHDGVGCTGCHAIHTAKGDIIFAVAPNKSAVNPKTKTPYTGTTALCLGCHEESSKGGQGYAPVHANMSHPYGMAAVDPKVAKVPGELLREGGRFECLGCHDPHPSNPNYKYLRVDTGAKGQNMDGFCVVCHPIKADAAASATKAALFTSMDETGNRVMKAGAAAPAAAKPAAKPAPAAAPAKK
jgi:predicted CXXCH cytochrome family protein